MRIPFLSVMVAWTRTLTNAQPKVSLALRPAACRIAPRDAFRFRRQKLFDRKRQPVDLVMQIGNLGFGFEIDFIVERGGEAVLGGLPVLNSS